jgi:hypothetical protein
MRTHRLFLIGIALRTALYCNAASCAFAFSLPLAADKLDSAPTREQAAKSVDSATDDSAFETLEPNCGRTYGAEDEGELARFDAELRYALSTHDQAQMSLLVAFPLRINTSGKGSNSISDPRALQDAYPSNFSNTVVNAILNTAPNQVQCMRDGAMYGRGIVWVGSTVLNKKLVYRITTVNLPEKPIAPLKKGEFLVEFVCETHKQRILVDSAFDASFRFRAWNKPHLIRASPDLELTARIETRDTLGTGDCAFEQWRFSRGNATYTIGGLGCTDGSEPEGSRGFVQVKIGEVVKSELYCQ